MKFFLIKKINIIGLTLLMVAFLAACGVQFDIYFESNGGTEVESISTDGKSLIQIPTNPTKEGYVFAGWFWDNQTFNTPFTANSLLDTPLSSDMTVFAKWVNPNDVGESGLPRVTFHNTGDNDVTPLEIEFGGYVSPPSVSKEGHSLEGWYTSFDGGITFDERWSFNNTPVNINVNLYANWQVLEYTIHFDDSLLDFSLSSITNDFGTNFTLPTVSLEDHYFLGWTSDDGETVHNNTYTIKENITLTPIFKEINYYEIVFDLTSGGAIDSSVIEDDYPTITVQEYLSVDSIEAPTLEGYRFLGWQVSGASITVPFDYDFDEDITLVAMWEETLVYTIHFNTLTASAIEPITIEENTEVSDLPVPYMLGYTFLGWTLDDELIDLPFMYDFDEDITLTSTWAAVTVYEITFDTSNGTTVSAFKVNDGQVITELPESSLEDSRFMGWLLNDTLIEFPFEYNFNKDITLVPQFEIIRNHVTITLVDSLGETTTKTFNVGDQISLPIPSKSGYIFTNWFVDSEMTEAYIPNIEYENQTLYAGWHVDAYDFQELENEIIITKYNGNQSSIKIPEYINMKAVKSIGSHAFNNVNSTILYIPDNLEVIDSNAFQNMSFLQSIVISENSNLKEINGGNFNNTQFVSNLYIPKHVEYINYNIFAFSSSFSKFNVDVENKYYSSIDGVLYDKDQTMMINYPYGIIDTSYTFPDTVRSTGQMAFRNTMFLREIIFTENSLYDADHINLWSLPNLTKIVLPPKLQVPEDSDYYLGVSGNPMLNTVEVYSSSINYLVEDGVLYNKNKTIIFWSSSTNTGTFNVPDSVVIIARQGLSYSKYNEVIFGENSTLQAISYIGMDQMNALETIILPKTLEYIGSGALRLTNNLQNIYISNENQYFTSIEGILYSKDGKALVLFPSGREGTYIVPKEVEIIKQSAFNYTILDIIEFEDSSNIKLIEEGAIHQHSNPLTVYVPASSFIIENNGISVFNSSLRVYVSFDSKPDSWSEHWTSTDTIIIWGYTKE